MSVNETRSMNKNLEEGLTDGILQKIAPDRGGDDRDEYAAQRRNANLQSQYGAQSWANTDAQKETVERQTTLSEKRPPQDWEMYEGYKPDPPLCQ